MLKRVVKWLYAKVVGAPATEAIIVAHLSPEQLKRLAASLPNPIVGANTSELEAGYKLGVQATLAKISEGFVNARVS